MNEIEDEIPIEIELNPRELRLYDRLRSSVVAPQPGVSSSLRDMILLLPDLIVLLTRLLRDPRVPLGVKLIAGAGVAYVLSPIDLMPGILLGPLGLVDDLLVVSAVLSRLMRAVHPDVVRQHWSGQGDALDVVERVTTWADDQVTGRIIPGLRRLLPF